MRLRARELLNVAPVEAARASETENADHAKPPTFVCRHCGHAMLIVQALTRDPLIRAPP